LGLFLDKEVTVNVNDEVVHYKGDAIIVATGASENMVTFDGWTLSRSYRCRCGADNDESS